METYNDCYLFGFISESPKIKVNKDVWRITVPFYFLTEHYPNVRLAEIDVVLADSDGKDEFTRKKPFDILSLHGHIQRHTDGRLYLYLLEYTEAGFAKSKENAVMRLAGHTGSLLFLKGELKNGQLVVPRVRQKKNITSHDVFKIEGLNGKDGELVSCRCQINADGTIRKKEVRPTVFNSEPLLRKDSEVRPVNSNSSVEEGGAR